LVTLDEAPAKAGFFFKDEVQPIPEELVAKKLTPAESAAAARRAYDLLSGLSEINVESAEEPLRALADELGLKPGQLFGILRVAVTGQRVSPPLFESMEIVGVEKTLERIRNAIQILGSMN
jgi:glutamyl-tRNA synthetase